MTSNTIRLEYHTTDPRQIELCDLYWEHDSDLRFPVKTAELADAFNIPRHELARHVTECCSATSQTQFCASCRKAHIYSNRTDFQSRLRLDDSICPDCLAARQAARDEEYRKQIELRESADAAEESWRREIIRRHFGAVLPIPDFQQLPLDSAVYFLSVVRAGSTEDFAYLRALDSLAEKLAPTQEMERKILLHLYGSRLLEIHPGSNLDAFEIVGDKPPRFYARSVAWLMPGFHQPGLTKPLVSGLEAVFRDSEWPASWQGQTLELWKTISLHECVEYLVVGLQDQSYPSLLARRPI
jgi:uncharacterized protein CbrC (UPF0167 family)